MAQTEYEEVIDSLVTFKNIAEGSCDYTPIASLDIPERFRWLDSCSQYNYTDITNSRGKTDDLNKTFDRLFKELVA